jgi:DNA-binding MarR family transcriptional regulator
MKLTSDQMCADILALLSHSKGAALTIAEEYNLTPVQMFSLYSLDMRGEISMGHIAEMLHCDASNVTGIVDRLTARGLVVRQENSRDRRTKTLVLTDKGKDLVTLLKAALPVKFGCDRLTDEEQFTLHTIAQKLT